MPDILHRISIDADTDTVRELVSTKRGVADWWSAHPAGGTDRLCGTMEIFFGGSKPAAVMEIVEDSAERVVWRCLEGPPPWVGTEINFRLDAQKGGGTTLVFTHAGWRESSDFMAHCSMNWSAYLTSLKKGAEGEAFTPFPAGEVSRWS